MKYTLTFTTKGGRREDRKFSELHGPSNDLCKFYSPTDFKIEIRCSTEEAEIFEAETKIELDSDVPSEANFAALVNWLRDNAGLKVSGMYEK
ncbi:MAG: hypothetical protein KGL39_02735 [Patescibacteria group bacterium]|nr:hypothetical protein [Patescibacteria group bacterium]